MSYVATGKRLPIPSAIDPPIGERAGTRPARVYRRLISAGADPTDVQKALRHSSLRITLETYVHWWPKKERRRNVVGTALRAASEGRPKTESQS